MKTKNGIELELNKSEYIFMVDNYEFYFSSELYRKKFREQIEEYLNMETQKIVTRYKVNINLNLYLAIALYKKIEKRGFLIKKGNEILSEDLKLYSKLK